MRLLFELARNGKKTLEEAEYMKSIEIEILLQYKIKSEITPNIITWILIMK